MSTTPPVQAPLVVLIEDHEDLREVLTTVLEHGGMRVAAYPGGAEGLVATRALKPQLLITDLMVAEPNGLEIARQLTEHDGTRPVPVVLLSARSDTASMAERGNLFDAVIPKPVDPAELLTVAQSLVARDE